MAEEENIVAELHGHFDQLVRTTLAGGLGLAEQRARRRQSEAEAERALATQTARQLQERKRTEREAIALATHLGTTQRDERLDQGIDPSEPAFGQAATLDAGADWDRSVLDLDADVDRELEFDLDLATTPDGSVSEADLGR